MHISQSIDGYKVSSLADGMSSETITRYIWSLKLFSRYILDKDISLISSDDLKKFMAYLKTDYVPHRKSASNEPLSTASHHAFWKALRSFFRWASVEFSLKENPALALKMPKFINKEVVPFSESDLRAILKVTDLAKPVDDGSRNMYACHRPTARRDHALIMTFIDTGIRVGELCRLLISDINLETGELQILPHHVNKTRPRLVWLGKAARRSVWRYLAQRTDTRPSDYLFVDPKNDHPMTPNSVKALIYGLAERAKVQNAFPHKFRHTFAIQYLRNGGDVFTLQRLLGHSDLMTVKRYLSIADTDTAEAHRRASPVDNWRL